MALIDTLKVAFGSAWHTNSDAILKTIADAIDGVGTDVTPGTAKASSAVILDANKAVDVVRTSSLRIGVSGSEVPLTTTPARLNALNIPDAQYSTGALQSAAIPAANMAGAKTVDYENTGTTPGSLPTDTAVAIVAAIPGAQVGQAYRLKIRNSSSGANTATITAGLGVTLHGTMTIAQNVTREFVVVLTSLTAVDIYSMGVSAAAA